MEYLSLEIFVFCPEMLLREKCSVIGSCERLLDWRQLSAVMGLGQGDTADSSHFTKQSSWLGLFKVIL